MKNIFNRKKPTIWAIIMVCAFTFTVGIFKLAMYDETAATAASKKELPIYCVDTQGKKQVAISFDAAWGAGSCRKNFFIVKSL